ncbi:hypothetical protein E2C01_061128 [Portunus trituberculatus]|uniref:Uncharacterized protein n=1 Tax=Portunus trituberculatus TaxID=210409 RepID=A0A5B7HAV1_PORTR|nr:hypothetical protein [Portunus trituberculatus]
MNEFLAQAQERDLMTKQQKYTVNYSCETTFIPYVPAIVYERLHQCVCSDGDRSRNQEFSRLMFELLARFLESDGEWKYLASFYTCSVATSSIFRDN